jgi:hypothetical protein
VSFSCVLMFAVVMCGYHHLVELVCSVCVHIINVLCGSFCFLSKGMEVCAAIWCRVHIGFSIRGCVNACHLFVQNTLITTTITTIK